MDLKQLRYFVRIVDLGSLSRAASDVHIVQSALSQHVAALEDEFGTALLHRTGRGVTPTDAGTRLYRHAQLLLRQADETAAAVRQGVDEPAGPASLGLPLSLVTALGLEIVAGVQRLHPRIRLLVQEGVSGSILEWTKNGRLSCGLAFDDGNLDGLRATHLVEERMFLVVSPHSRLARRKVIALAELENVPLLMPSPQDGVRPAVEQAMARHGLRLATVGWEANSFKLLKLAAEADLAPTVLTWPGIAQEVAERRLVALEIVRPAITRTCALCVLDSAAHNPVTRALADAVLAVVREVVDRARWRGARYVGPG